MKSERDSFKYNTIDRMIFRADFYSLPNIDEKIQDIDEFLRQKYNLFYSNMGINLADYDLDDPTPLITEKMLEKNIRGFLFVNKENSCRVFMNRNIFIVENTSFEGYRGFEGYFDIFCDIYKKLNRGNGLRIARFGIKKNNEISFLSEESLKKNIKKDFLLENDKPWDMMSSEGLYTAYSNDNISVNRRTRLLGGELAQFPKFRFTLAIDSYKRYAEDNLDIKSIQKDGKAMNECIFKEFRDTITSDFYDQLCGKTQKDDSIIGVKSNATR